MINADRPQNGETWASITTRWNNEIRNWLGVSKLITNETPGYFIQWINWLDTWAAETRTWDELSSFAMTNLSKGYIVLWSDWTQTWDEESRTWSEMGLSGLTNLSKPI